MPENVDAVKVYSLVQAQTKDHPSGKPKDIDIQAVIEVLKLYGLYKKKTFDKVVSLCRHMITGRK